MPHSKLHPDDWRGRNVLVMGLGLFGGNVSATRYLASRGANIAITDLRNKDALAPSLAALNGIPLVRLTLERHDEADIDWADTLLISPAVKPSNPFIAYAQSQNKTITTELELFLRACPAKIAAVTGSNGKSTTTTMLSHILRVSGHPVHLGGNIGHSLLDDLDQIQASDWIALEVSSFQLAWLPEGLLKPEVAILTNLTPNHLDWHPDFDDYSASKAKLFQHAKHAILPDQTPSNWKIDPARISHFNSRELLSRRAGGVNPLSSFSLFPLPGEHNLLNAQAAMTAGLSLGFDVQPMLYHLAEMKSLSQRLETIASHNGVTFINDSAATTPESTLEALRSLDGPLHLIVGGSDKGADFTAVSKLIVERCASVALIGYLAPRLEALILKHQVRPLPLASHTDLATALDWSILQATTRPATILLSPAAASFGMYLNYEQRGQDFNRLVAERTASISCRLLPGRRGSV
ncbi:Mur ligase family protein [Lacunimicrobium album]